MTSRRSMVVMTLVLLACKTPPTDDKPSDQLDKAQLAKEQRRVENGEVVGFALQAPKLSVDAQQITINGYRVGPRSDLDSANELKRITSVFGSQTPHPSPIRTPGCPTPRPVVMRPRPMPPSLTVPSLRHHG